jgi:DNA-binding CsgD family transcriptional regulator
VPTATRSELRLWGRHDECERLDRLLADARGGTSGALVLLGEAGVGKTALLDYLLANAAGCRIVRASGVESEMELAFAGLHQLCAPLLDRLDRIRAPQRGALESAFGLRAGDPPDRFLVGLAVLSLLSDAAEAQPLICLLDDAQWLDQISAQVLGFVARRLAAEAVVMFFAVRQQEDEGPFIGLPRLVVGPLRETDARELLTSAIPGRLDASVRDRIVAESRGNPLALLELPRAWTPAAFAGGFELPGGVSVSGRIEESFRRRLAPLTDQSRSLLLLVAAEPVGDPLLVRSAAERLGIPMEAAEPATAAGLLDFAAQPLFRHPLARSVVYQNAPIGRRRQVHAALADVTDAKVDPDRRAWHLAAAAKGPDDEVASELERSAGRAQSRGGMAAAAAFLQRAAELSVDSERRTERALAAAQASLQAGAFDATLRLLRMAEAGPLEGFQRARVDLLRAHVAFASGLGGDAPPLLLAAARQVESFNVELARETYLVAWASAGFAGSLREQEVLKEISVAIKSLPKPGSPRPLDLLVDGLALLITDGYSAAASPLQRAAKALATIPIEDVLRWGWMAYSASAATWDIEGMLAISSRQAQLARGAGALAQLPLYLSGLCLTVTWMGDFGGAASLVAEGESVARATGSRFDPSAALWLAAVRGREPEASESIASALEQAAAGGPVLSGTNAQWAASFLYNGLAQYEKAASAARRATSSDFPWPTIWALPELVEAAGRLGEVDRAQQALERLAETTQPAGTDWALGIEARCRAVLSDGRLAEEGHREAIDRLTRTRLRPEIARAHLLYGEWLRREGRRVDARQQLRGAYDLFAAIGMEAFGERARRELVATGETVRKRVVDTINDLTPQEAQIARLASDGMMNSEIGAQLFLSPRTVEWHLRKVFAKLGVSSRRELQAALPAEAHTAVTH